MGNAVPLNRYIRLTPPSSQGKGGISSKKGLEIEEFVF